MVFSKKASLSQMFKEALSASKNAIEAKIWNGIGDAIYEECGGAVQRAFHHLMGTLIDLFTDMLMRLDPEKLDDKLIDHLQRQLKTLEKDTILFKNILGRSHSPNRDKDVRKMIEDFRVKLWEFYTSMEPYLKKRT